MIRKDIPCISSMASLLSLLSVILAIAILGGAHWVEAASPPVYVQYHLWYTDGDEQLPGYQSQPPNYGRWHMWSQTTKHVEVENGIDPNHFLNPWRRVTASRLGLPLVGPYSSMAHPGTRSEGASSAA